MADEKTNSEAAYGGVLGKIKGLIDNANNKAEDISQLNLRITTMISDIISSGVKNARDIQNVQFNISRSLGQTRAMAESMINTAHNALTYANKIALNYNLSTEKLLNLQKSIQESFGKQTAIATDQIENLAAINNIFGDEKKTGEFIGKYTKLGVSMQTISSQVGKMYATAAKEGLSLEKISAKVNENISKVNQYGFRNGIDGLREMAAYSEKIGMSLESTLRAADKLGSLQDSIETSAQLTNLGFITNPLELLGNAVTDVESLQKQIGNMFQNMGRFNKETGQFEINSFNRLRAKQMASSLGIDYGEAINSIEVQGRRAEIERQASGLNIDERLKNYIANTGTFENGMAGTVYNGQFYNLNALSQNQELQREIVSVTQEQSDDVKDIAKEVRSLAEILSGTQNDALVRQEIAQMEQLNARLGELTGGTDPLLLSQGFEMLENGLTNASKVGLQLHGDVLGMISSLKKFDGSVQGMANIYTDFVGSINTIWNKQAIPLFEPLNEGLDDIFDYVKGIYKKLTGNETAQHGGYIMGRSHAEGGTLIEAERGEYIVNRNASKQFLPLLESINSYQNPGPLNGKGIQQFRGGGMTSISSPKTGVTPINNNYNVPISITTNFKTEENSSNIQETFKELQPLITDWLNRKFREDASYGATL